MSELLSAEQLASMGPAEVMAYVKAMQDSLAAAKSVIAVAQEKQTAESRKALQEELRGTLLFPTLGADVLSRVKATGATGFVVVYDLESGAGTLSATYSVTRKAVSASSKAVAYTPRANARDLNAEYEAATTPAERLEDEARLEERVVRARAKGSYPKQDRDGNDIVPYEFDEATARNSNGWSIKDARIKAAARAAAKTA